MTIRVVSPFLVIRSYFHIIDPYTTTPVHENLQFSKQIIQHILWSDPIQSHINDFFFLNLFTWPCYNAPSKKKKKIETVALAHAWHDPYAITHGWLSIRSLYCFNCYSFSCLPFLSMQLTHSLTRITWSLIFVAFTIGRRGGTGISFCTNRSAWRWSSRR